LGKGNPPAEAVDETVGLGAPILQWKETPVEWQYRLVSFRHHWYTRSPVPGVAAVLAGMWLVTESIYIVSTAVCP
jgi:hypothetical protein